MVAIHRRPSIDVSSEWGQEIGRGGRQRRATQFPIYTMRYNPIRGSHLAILARARDPLGGSGRSFEVEDLIHACVPDAAT
ncbi:protein of unknown function (plasmid) [Cupriavidus taiwanensis]|uniref:Uncharacterized protein n=1 Tax=Cupriavidus taiwanensis TaxID=164546 RepID=A0A375ISW9_9BURK|nr:protein of unknown function [Cupriavidus taiwanensis]